MNEIKQVLTSYGLKWFRKSKYQAGRIYDEDPLKGIIWEEIFELLEQDYRAPNEKRKLIESVIFQNIFGQNGQLEMTDVDLFFQKTAPDKKTEPFIQEIIKMLDFSYYGIQDTLYSRNILGVVTLETIYRTVGEGEFTTLSKNYNGKMKRIVDQINPEYKVKRIFHPGEAEKETADKLKQSLLAFGKSVKEADIQALKKEIAKAVFHEDTKRKKKMENLFV